jgi:hypothetical protein
MPQEEYLPPTLVIQQGPDAGKSFPLDKDIVTIGSTEENDIVINNPDVSSHHALISKREGAWVIEDLGSKSGVWVNAKRVKQPVFMRDGTRINLGPNVMLTAQGAGLGAAETQKKGGCWKPTLLGLIGLALLSIVLVAAAAVGYFYIYPTYFQSQASGEYPLNTGPEVTLQEPLPGTQFQQGDSFLVFVTARDEEGVNRIDLWVNDQLVASQSSPGNEGLNPFSLHHGMSADEPGRYMMVARAFNPSGEMGESLTINIEVADQTAAEPTPDSAVYIAEEGDTIEKIASKSNNSAGGIQNANPGIKNPVKPKRKVNVNNPPDQKKPDPPKKGAGVNPLPSGAADILPGFLPGSLPSIKIAEMLPAKTFPDKDSINLLPGFKLEDPDPLKAVPTGECKVALTWKEIKNEDGYRIYRQITGEIKPREIKSPGPNVGNLVDTVPGPAIYEYKVVAYSGSGIQAQTSSSNFAQADVPETPKCKSLPLYKQIIFQPISFYPTSKNIPLGSIKVDIGNFWNRIYRIPTNQSKFFPVGELGSQYKLTWPAPENIYLSDDSETILKIIGTGGDPSKGGNNNPAPIELKYFYANHDKNDLTAPDSKDKIWTGKAEGFNLWYKVWIEDWMWTNKSFSNTIPSPKNLRFGQGSNPDYRYLDWDFDKDYENRIDGFILYRKYNCPGKNEQIKFPQPIVRYVRTGSFKKSTEPVGCSCTFQVSAYGPEGESKPSEPQKEKCYTESPSDSLEVTFSDLTIEKSKINNPTGAAASEIYIFANEYSRRSARMLLEGKKYSLEDIPLDGQEENNSVIVGMAPDDSLKLGFYISDICQSKDLVIKKSGQTWQGFDQGHTIESPGGFCKVTVNITDRASGPAPIPGAGPQIKSPISAKCARDSECETGFCDDGICAPTGDGMQNEYCHKNAHCESGVCLCPNGREGENCRGFEKFDRDTHGVCQEGFENGDFCTKNRECASGYCANDKCAPPDGTGRLGDYCHHINHCGNHYCVCPSGKDGNFCKDYKYFTSDPGNHGYCGQWYGLKNGASCTANDQCSSRHCANDQCAPIDKTGLADDYCHHNNHCISGTCWCDEGKDGAFCEKDDDEKYTAGKCSPP